VEDARPHRRRAFRIWDQASQVLTRRIRSRIITRRMRPDPKATPKARHSIRSTVLLRLPYLALSSLVAVIRLLPVNGTEKDIEILALRHQLSILQRQIDEPKMTGTDRAFLAALLHRFPRPGCGADAADRRPGHHLALAS
jgi:hypothetical protein